MSHVTLMNESQMSPHALSLSVFYSVLQCVAVYCSVQQYIVVFCSVLQCIVVCSSIIL